VKGPMEVFGYNYMADHYGSEKTKALRLPKTDNGEILEYEVLNFVDGKRNVQEITSLLSGAYGPIAVDVVVEYLKALESIGVVTSRRAETPALPG
jgi:aminopeptidase YwaD